MDYHTKNEVWSDRPYRLILTSTLGMLISCLFIWMVFHYFDNRTYLIIIDLNNGPFGQILDPRFLSVALDVSVIATGFKSFNMSNPKLEKLLRPLAPGFFRVGGTMADRLIFVPDPNLNFKIPSDLKCSRTQFNFSMNPKEWYDLNRLINRTGFELIFGLNGLLRTETGNWDYRNAELLLKTASQWDFPLNLELGNEPNAYLHKFNMKISAEQLSADFSVLKSLVHGRNMKILGPDIGRPKFQNLLEENSTMDFLSEFLVNGAASIDAITWHQYYFEKDDVCSHNMLSPHEFDVLKWQIRQILNAANVTDKPIWLGETSSVTGGGADGYSNTFIGSFNWLDKLGVCAEWGMQIVIRQSIAQGHYALINEDYQPNPDWWVSVLYKKVVGDQPIVCQRSDDIRQIRFYCHRDSLSGKLTLYGINLHGISRLLEIKGLEEGDYFMETFVLTSNLYSSEVLLNGVTLKLKRNGDVPVLKGRTQPFQSIIELQPYSLNFIVIGNSSIFHLNDEVFDLNTANRTDYDDY